MEHQAQPMQVLAPEAEKETADVSAYAERRKQDPTVLLALHVGFIMLLYMVVLFTFPIDDLSNIRKGLTNFLYDEVQYTYSNGEIGTFETVHTLDDIVGYSESLLKNLLSETSVGRRPPDEQYLLLGAHRLINSVVLVQRRVAPGNCSTLATKGLHEGCYDDSSSRELTFGIQHLKNGVEVPYSPDFGGFAVELPLNRSLALDRFEELKDGRFWDRNTRDVSVLFGIHNAAGQYTGNVRAEFVLSPYGPRYGSIRSRVDAGFFRLLPYADPLQGCILIGLQVWTIIHWFVLIGLLVRRFVMQPHVRWKLAIAFEPWTVMELIGNMFIVYAMYVWYSYLHDPRRTHADFDSPHYQDLVILGGTFQSYIFCLSAATVLWAARLVQFVQAFRHKQARVTAAIVESVFESLFFFGLVFCILVVGFVFVFDITDLRRLPHVTDLWNAFDTVALWFAAVSDGRRDMVDITGGPAFFLFFLLVCFVLLINMFVLMVMEAQERVAEEQSEEANGEAGKPRMRRRLLAHRLSDAVCDFLGVPVCEAELYEYDIEEQREDTKRSNPILDRIGWIDDRG
jgi:hypothetical protein